MKLNVPCAAALVLVSLASLSCHPEEGIPGTESLMVSAPSLQEGVAGPQKVLILGSSVSGGDSSREAQAAASLGYQVQVVTPEQWGALSSRDFMQYVALIIGDAGCQTGESAFQAAILNREIWGHIIDGAVVIIGADPVTNATPQLVENAIKVAATGHSGTGLYVALGCAYKDAPVDTPVALLEPIGNFKVAGVDCASSAHRFMMQPTKLSANLSDAALPGAGCAARSVFTQYPDRNFAYAILAMKPGESLPGERIYRDYTAKANYSGTPYVLVRGAMAVSAGCGSNPVAEGEECDLGDFSNGRSAWPGEAPDATCSWSCKRAWCGDGFVDTIHGEECDEGTYNGRDIQGNPGTCTASCKLSPRPPQALCRNVTIAASPEACGAAADIDNGSHDPDGDLVGCTQDPPGPYAIGATRVTLRCTDARGDTASCTGMVMVLDKGAPAVSLLSPEPMSLECRTRYSEPGATASDLCAGDLTGSIVRTGTVDTNVPGTYTLSYDVMDAAGNSAPTVRRTVKVVDTQPPRIVCPEPLVLQAIEGRLANVTLGAAEASDDCDPAPRISGPTEKSYPVGTTSLEYTATDASGNQASCTSTVTVQAIAPPETPKVIDWDRAVLGSGNGCATSGREPASLALLGLMGLAALLARKLRR
jgi:large repetitive protein